MDVLRQVVSVSFLNRAWIFSFVERGPGSWKWIRFGDFERRMNTLPLPRYPFSPLASLTIVALRRHQSGQKYIPGSAFLDETGSPRTSALSSSPPGTQQYLCWRSSLPPKKGEPWRATSPIKSTRGFDWISREEYFIIMWFSPGLLQRS